MIAPADLYDVHGDVARYRGLHLVVAMHGFADAGSAAEVTATTLFETLPHERLVTFDTDVLIDHRSRRPTFHFDTDHITSFEAHRLSIDVMTDDEGTKFLLLSGPEPDWLWERFAAAVTTIVREAEVASVTLLSSIPMPVPHTRPLGTTVSGNRADLIEAYSVWKPTSIVPAAVMHLLEYRLSPDMPVATFVVLVPHYLGDAGSAGPVLAALSSVTNATGLVFRTEDLRQQDRDFQSRLAEQMDSNEELRQVVGHLEERYDEFMEGTSVRSPLVDDDGALPTADEIAAAFEQFLERQRPFPPES